MFFSKKLLLLTLFSTLAFCTAFSAEPLDKKEDKKKEIKKYITHHLKDSHSFYLTSYTNVDGKKVYIELPLPVILYDSGFKFFMSSDFKHGKEIVADNESFYRMNYDNNKIYKTNSQGDIIKDENGKITNEKPIDFSITKNIATILLVSFFMLFLFNSLARSYSRNNGIADGLGRFLEPIILYVRDEIAIPGIGQKKYKNYMSYLLTVFFFIWFLNMLGLTPLGVNVTGNIAVTFSLALLTFLLTNLTANKNYWGHIFWMPGVPIPLKIILAPIEFLGLFIKPFSLLIRLYANIQAGHIVLYSLIGLMFVFQNWIGSSLSFVLAFFISIIEILVALLQAYIFTMLSALYFGFAVEEHGQTEH